MIDKWALMFYVTSSVLLGYTALIHSPFSVESQSWERTNAPFFLLCTFIILLLHVVFTAKMLKDEKYQKVIKVSSFILLISALIYFKEFIIAYASYWLATI